MTKDWRERFTSYIFVAAVTNMLVVKRSRLLYACGNSGRTRQCGAIHDIDVPDDTPKAVSLGLFLLVTVIAGTRKEER